MHYVICIYHFSMLQACRPISAILLQDYDDGYHPIAYFSKKYLPAERNYAPHDKELLAVFKACMKWWYYIDGH